MEITVPIEQPKIITAPSYKLNNDTKIPIIGLGTWKSNAHECFSIVQAAIDIGYRHFDTALVYGNEREVGDAIKSKIKEGKVAREDIYLCTKLANIHHEPSVVEYACRKSLENLRLEYIDLYLIHFPVAELFREEYDPTADIELSDVDYLNTWWEMEKLVDKGLVRSIGLSNFNSEQITRILENCRIRPVVNQIECHPGFNQKQLIKFCKRHFIHVVAYSPLGRPDPDHRQPPYMYDNTIKKLSAKYGRTPAEICLRYVLQLGAYPIPKTVDKSRLMENFSIFDFIIYPEDMAIMDKYNQKRRLIPFSVMKEHEYYPFNIPF